MQAADGWIWDHAGMTPVVLGYHSQAACVCLGKGHRRVQGLHTSLRRLFEVEASVRAEARGAAQKAVFGYLLGPSVQGAARAYEQFPLNTQVRPAAHSQAPPR